MGQIPIKGQNGQFMESNTRWQNLTSPNAFHWLISSREDTLDDEKEQERWDFTLLTLTKKEQGVSITDCHAGNPFMLKYGVTHRLSTAYHPQTSGQVEMMHYGPSVPHSRHPLGALLISLYLEKLAILPIALEHIAMALKHCNFDLKTAGDHRKVQINELNELRDQAYENSLIYKEKTKKIQDSKIKNRVFNVGD
ncbi:reverse transcriptase domain-containing protein [Tanacetum coccineum]